MSVAINPDGTRIVSGSGDPREINPFRGKIKTWDASTGKEIASIETLPVKDVAFSPNGEQIVSGFFIIRGSDYDLLKVYNAETGEEELVLGGKYEQSRMGVVFTPDGKRIIAGTSSGRIQFWDVASGQLFRMLFPDTKASMLYSIAISSDGKYKPVYQWGRQQFL